mmetsp:Transcript_48836/g.145954  ORF Transcript_48836/g.145954 Transcript_48836/m.145954 type:complete len:356 (+) Transcript_48836:1251-2318(+)
MIVPLVHSLQIPPLPQLSPACHPPLLVDVVVGDWLPEYAVDHSQRAHGDDRGMEDLVVLQQGDSTPKFAVSIPAAGRLNHILPPIAHDIVDSADGLAEGGIPLATPVRRGHHTANHCLTRPAPQIRHGQVVDAQVLHRLSDPHARFQPEDPLPANLPRLLLDPGELVGLNEAAGCHIHARHGCATTHGFDALPPPPGITDDLHDFLHACRGLLALRRKLDGLHEVGEETIPPLLASWRVSQGQRRGCLLSSRPVDAPVPPEVAGPQPILVTGKQVWDALRPRPTAPDAVTAEKALQGRWLAEQCHHRQNCCEAESHEHPLRRPLAAFCGGLLLCLPLAMCGNTLGIRAHQLVSPR